MISKYDKNTQTLTLTIPGMIMLPEWTDDAKTKKQLKRKSPNGRLEQHKRASPKKTSRKKSSRRRTSN